MLAKVTFGPVSNESALREAQEDLVAEYLGALKTNGQALSRGIFATVDGLCRGYLDLSRREATEPRHHSRWGAGLLGRLGEAFGGAPAWEVIEDDPAAEEAPWEASTSLVLYTYFLEEDQSPVVRSDDGEAVALFLLPTSDEDREAVSAWAWEYRAHDAVWFYSGDLETAAYKEMAEPSSALSQQGRGAARAVESATGRPTYYYLPRYWGRRRGEEDRPCPGCGSPWRTAPPEEERPWWAFPFRCDGCRLVSHDASTTNDERRARLGEYRAGSGREEKGA